MSTFTAMILSTTLELLYASKNIYGPLIETLVALLNYEPYYILIMEVKHN